MRDLAQGYFLFAGKPTGTRASVHSNLGVEIA
jgi:hypothetical protein